MTMVIHGNDERETPTVQRWLVAGDAAWPQRLRDALPEDAGEVEWVHVPTFLAALGHLGHEPADVVIGPAALLRNDLRATTDALRELAPQAKLLLVAEAAEAGVADEAVDAGFDAWLSPPVTQEALTQALSEREPVEAPPNAEGAAEADGAGGGGAGTEENEQLGDIDLIERILGGAGLRAAAMKVVRGRSQCQAIAIADDEKAVPAGHSYSRIALRGRDFGVLHAPEASATQQDIAGWAGWLAHWLALDEQVSLLKDLSMRDALTGVWNRRYFDRFLKRILDWAGRERSQVTLLVFDIDDFKVYNDRYGHAAGDDILRECSKLMLSVVREHDVVARIGGDEFAVIFWDADPRQAPRQPNSRHPEDVVSAATRFQRAICSHQFPKLLNEAPGTLTISGGLASFPWDGRTPQELLDKADEMAMQSKRQGKNAIKFGPGAERVCQSIQRD